MSESFNLMCLVLEGFVMGLSVIINRDVTGYCSFDGW